MVKFIIIFIFASSVVEATLDLNNYSVDYALEKFKIDIPGFKRIFNPSIVKWNGKILMSFRIPEEDTEWQSYIGLIWLNESFIPIGKPYILDTRHANPDIPSRSQDARLFVCGDSLYIAFNDHIGSKDKGSPRMCYSKVLDDNKKFLLNKMQFLEQFEGERKTRWEKNWVPFIYDETILFGYTILPHRILKPFFGACHTIANTKTKINWKWGIERLFGGTPALLNGNEYLAFFHSSCLMKSKQSDKKHVGHYFIGAYTFEQKPPFHLKKISSSPIIIKGMYEPNLSKHRIIFPGGFIMDEKNIWLAYGKDDREIWILKLDKRKLMKSLINLKDSNES